MRNFVFFGTARTASIAWAVMLLGLLAFTSPGSAQGADAGVTGVWVDHTGRGAVESLGVTGRFEPGFNSTLGFDGITIAMLARTNPLGTIPAALLIGALRAGSAKMSFDAGVPPELIDVIQALILFFVAAPAVIRWLLRLRRDVDGSGVRLAGWGG